MTLKRAHNAFRKMRSGTVGGQSRVATPPSPYSFTKPGGTPPAAPVDDDLEEE